MQRLGVDEGAVEVEEQRGDPRAGHEEVGQRNSGSPAATVSPVRSLTTAPGRVSSTQTMTIGLRSAPGDLGGVPPGDRLAGRDGVLLGDEQLEPVPLEADRVDAEVHEHARALGGEHHEGVRVQLEQRARDGRHGIRQSTGRLDRDPGADHLGREDRVGHLGERTHQPRDRGEHVGHIRSSMSSAMLSASGPTTTWTTDPAVITPCAPAALSAFSSTSVASLTSVRSRVMHGSISMMLSAPPRPARICSALLLM